MFGGYPDEDDDEDQQPHPPGGAGRGAGPSAMLASLMGGGGMGWAGQPVARAPPRAYDEYFKAYSVAMLPGRERANLSYGGKIIMPQSALANLTNLDVELPWMFQLRNPSNPAASTHAGVMEFIAQEGCVHLPYWMMKTLRLEEGEPIRITGAKLPKGKLIKIQPQQLHFLEITDPKALLEQALRNFTCLTAGDVIELTYNSIVLDFLIMDIQPPGPGILVIDTDLEVDFAAPKGYVEPARPAPAPAETMASRLKIDLSSSTPGSSRPTSALGGVPATNTNGDFESFKGLGNTLSGRKTKGKGKSVRKVQPVDPNSKIYRTDKPTMMTNELLGDARPAPAPLTLPFGKLFFGFTVVPYKAPDATAVGTSQPPVQAPAFSGGPGNTLSGRAPRAPPVTQPSASSTPVAPSVGGQPVEDKWKGKGNILSGAAPKGRRPPRSPSPEYIEIDSD